MAIEWHDMVTEMIDPRFQIILIVLTLFILGLFTFAFGVISRMLKRRSVESQSLSWWADFWQGISTEFFGAIVTTIFLGLGLLIFDQYQDIQNRQDELQLQMGSPYDIVANEAVRQLRLEGWLSDGLLRGVRLESESTGRRVKFRLFAGWKHARSESTGCKSIRCQFAGG